MSQWATDNRLSSPGQPGSRPDTSMPAAAGNERGGLALAPLAAEWGDLETAAAVSPTQHFIWSQSAAEAFHDAKAPQPIVVRDRGRVVAIASLARTGSPLPRLETMGVRELFEPTDFLYADAEALAMLADRLARQSLPLLLLRVPDDSPMVAALTKAFRRRGVIHSTPISPCPFIDLDASWAEPEKHFNSGRRSDFRRALRHAEQMGPVTFEVLSPALGEVAGLIDKTRALGTMVGADAFRAAGMAALSVDGGLWAYERIKRKLQARKAQDGKPQNGTAPDAKPPDAKPQNGEKAD